MFGLSNSKEAELEEFSSEEEKISGERLHCLEESFSEQIIESDILICLLVATGGKKGGDITADFDSRESFDKFISLMNSLGVNCFVNFDPELTSRENMANFFEDEEVSEELDRQVEEAEVRASIFLTKQDSYNSSFFENLEKLKERDRPRYHRLYGEFLGIPEENINCFIYDQRSSLSKKLLELFREPPPETISDWDLAEKFREKISEEEKDSLRTFLYSMYPEREESLEKALRLAEERKQSLEEHGINPEKYIEMFREESWTGEN